MPRPRNSSWLIVPLLLLAAACRDSPSELTDLEPPELLSLELVPDQIEAEHAGPVTAALLVAVRDPGGVASVSADLLLPDGSTRACSGALTDGNAADGVWRCPVSVDSSDPTGEWKVEGVALEDRVGNSANPALPSPPPVLRVVAGGFEDLTVRFIERLPRLEWVPDSPDPSRDGWPAEGEDVEWTAHVKNWSTATREVGYQWYIDDAPAGNGSLTVPGDTTATASLPWSWTFDRHRIRFVLDPEDQVPEVEEGNNSLEVFSDALSVGFWVEQSVMDALVELQPQVDGVRATSFGDWAQRHIDRFNEMAAEAVYPETPEGVLDRLRLDLVVVVPDGALPSPSNPSSDRTVDLMWGFDRSFADLLTALGPDGPARLNGTLLHELGHARYLVDLYATRVFHGLRGHTIEVTENGEPIVGQGFFPDEFETEIISDGESQEGWYVRSPIHEGLMSQDYSFIDRYSAAALNLIAGHRATEGNQNAPQNLGVFMDDLPADTRLRLMDEETGEPLARAEVSFFGALWAAPATPAYGRLIDATADVEVIADDDGIASLGRPPFDQDGEGRITVNTSVGIVRVEHEGRVGYVFLDSTLLNLAYWGGDTGVHVRDVPVALR